MIPFVNVVFCDSDELMISGKGYDDLWDWMSESFDDKFSSITRSENEKSHN
jgi:hypothetical protein